MSNVKTYVALMFLLMLAFGVSFLDFGAGNLVLSLSIAVAKALFIVLFFMRLKVSPKLTRYTAFVGVLWLSALFILGMADYASRRWHPLPGTWPQKLPAEAGANVN